MCLRITKDATIKIADKDIPCYKVLRKANAEGEWYISPFQRTPYELGELKSAIVGSPREFDENALFSEMFKLKDSLAIDDGLHTFTNENDANDFTNGLTPYVVFAAVIPKGAEYYIGEFDLIRNLNPLSWKSYVSSQLIVKEAL